jgi:DNA topoisomerase-1
VADALIIVESPAKARTISNLLGKGFVVESSIGHIRDLPSKTAEIPAAQRKKPWARLGVDIESGFRPVYVVPADKRAQVKKLKDLLSNASELYVATDEDREGEAIAWHLVEVLKPQIPVRRMVFHEITKRAIDQAIEKPRDIDSKLVAAQEARRILDRLYGYEISPVLWRKVRPRLSAGRVQSVATRLVVERERARRAFISAGYWSVSALLEKEGVRDVAADLIELDGRRIATGRHFDPATGKLTASATADRVLIVDEALSGDMANALLERPFHVIEVQKKPFTQRPAPPFITSTLQQEAGRKLGFAAKRTMRVAQRLYESGYITYMRTDSTTLSQEALKATRSLIEAQFGAEYLPEKPRSYTKKVKGAQEAHEAIRPAGEVFRTPDQLRAELDPEAIKLYELIWKRTLACQMKDARGERTSVRFAATIEQAITDGAGQSHQGKAIFSASGKVINFPGYLRVYVAGLDDPNAEREDREKLLPAMNEGDRFSGKELEAKEHETQPPSRFTEAALVKVLEEKGIGRPSTYATIIQTVQDRGYVWKQGNTLVPTLTAFAVVNLLEQHFSELVDYEFTALMETDLDDISRGEKESTPWLQRFYFGRNEKGEPNMPPKDDGGGGPEGPGGGGPGADGASPVSALERPDRPVAGTTPMPTLRRAGLKGMIGSGVEHIDARDVCSLQVGRTEEGDAITARVGRYGPYLQVGDSERRANIADDVLLDELDGAEALRLLREADVANRPLGTDPVTGKPVYLKSGSYGPYVQLGDPELTPKGNIKKNGKPKMASVWPTMDIEQLTLEDALLLLSYPKVIGKHPETKADITAHDGKFGPYIQMELAEDKRETRSLKDHEQLKSLTLEQAVEILKQPRQPRRQAASNSLIAELDPSPVTGAKIEVRDGRFGPYVTDGQVNATIPKNLDKAKITFDMALELIAAREQRMREQGKDPRAPKPARKKSTKKAGKNTTKKKATKKKGHKKSDQKGE